jgi:hypothetical protein
MYYDLPGSTGAQTYTVKVKGVAGRSGSANFPYATNGATAEITLDGIMG